MVEVVIPPTVLAVGRDISRRAGPIRIVNGIYNRDLRQLSGPTTKRFPMRAGLERPHAAIGPSAQYRTHNAVQGLPGQLPDIVQHYTMPNIKEGVTSIQTGHRGIRCIALSRSRAVGSSCAAVPCRSSVNRVAIGVVHVKQQAMTDLLSKRYLKRIVVGVDNVPPVAQVAVVVVRKTEVRRRSRSTAPVASPGAAKIIRYDRAEW